MELQGKQYEPCGGMTTENPTEKSLSTWFFAIGIAANFDWRPLVRA
ncbi:MAG: hypothetical protein ABNH38_09680 [Tateyamaria sp.]|jgi:hypothetical protein